MRIKQGVQKYIALFGVFCLSILAFLKNQISITVLGLTWFSVAFVALCFQQIFGQVRNLDKALRVGLSRTEQELASHHRDLTRAETETFRQIESLLTLYRRVDGLETMPHLRGWAVSPDLALELYEIVISGGVTQVLELGSGSSTAVIASALKSVGAGHLMSIEHDRHYANEVMQTLPDDLLHFVDIYCAPLVPHEVGEEEFLWYDLSEAAIPKPVDLLLVDGPPAAVGPQSRYPAFPLLEQFLSDSALIVLDDGRRQEEQQIVTRWASNSSITEIKQIQHERLPYVLKFERFYNENSETGEGSR